MSDEQTPTPHHHVAKVLIGEPFQVTPDGEQLNVITIARRVRIITVNGEIWEQLVSGFGPTPTELDVVKNWDVTYKTDWTRVNP